MSKRKNGTMRAAPADRSQSIRLGKRKGPEEAERVSNRKMIPIRVEPQEDQRIRK